MSITYIGLIVTLLGFVFQQAGVEVAPEKIQSAVEVAAQIVGLLVAFYGRYRQGDIKWFGKKI